METQTAIDGACAAVVAACLLHCVSIILLTSKSTRQTATDSSGLALCFQRQSPGKRTSCCPFHLSRPTNFPETAKPLTARIYGGQGRQLRTVIYQKRNSGDKPPPRRRRLRQYQRGSNWLPALPAPAPALRDRKMSWLTSEVWPETAETALAASAEL